MIIDHRYRGKEILQESSKPTPFECCLVNGNVDIRPNRSKTEGGPEFEAHVNISSPNYIRYRENPDDSPISATRNCKMYCLIIIQSVDESAEALHRVEGNVRSARDHNA